MTRGVAGLRRRVEVTPPPVHAVPGFARWVASECPPGARVLNIGAGANLSGRLAPVRRKAGYLVGVDPDPAVLDNPTLDEAHHMGLEEYARLDPEPFDLAFSVFVLEHVADPDAFAAACAAVLAPGGRLMALTVNKLQYFGLATWLSTRAGVAEPLLRRLRPPEQVDSYHFATEYRMNTVNAVSTHLQQHGFVSVDFRCWDLPSMYEPYLPRPVRGFATTWNRWAYRLDRPWLMGHLTFLARTGPDGGAPVPGPGDPPAPRLD